MALHKGWVLLTAQERRCPPPGGSCHIRAAVLGQDGAGAGLLKTS